MGKRTLTPDDLVLIAQCKDERARLDKEIAALIKKDRFVWSRVIDRLRRERAELTDAKLAEKFETTKYEVWIS